MDNSQIDRSMLERILEQNPELTRTEIESFDQSQELYTEA